MKRLVVIDGKSVFYRGYYAMKHLSTADGTPTGGVFGFTSLVVTLLNQLKPDYMAVAWDKPKTNIRKRLAIYPEYKAGRSKPPEDFFDQIVVLRQLLEAFGWPLYEIDDYEADDIMATFAKEATEKGIETCLITSDLDALQALSATTRVFALKTGFSSVEEFTKDAFEKKYQIKIEQFLDLKSLMGDTSDNLVGVKGIGQKTAVKLLREYGDLDNIYKNIDQLKGAVAQYMRDGKEDAYITKKVAKLYNDVPIKLNWQEADLANCDFAAVKKMIQKLEFHSLLKRLPEVMLDEADIPEVINLPDPLPLSSDFSPADQVFMHIENNQLFLSNDGQTTYNCNLDDLPTDFFDKISHAKIVAYDVKDLYHQLHKINVHFAKVHEVKQAAFLIDPLLRDRQLATLAGQLPAEYPQNILHQLSVVYQNQIAIFKERPDLKNIAENFDFAVIYPLFKMEQRGILLDKTILKTMSENLRTEVTDIEQQMYNFVGYEFNAASSAQLTEVLFEKLELPTKGIKKGKTRYSTSQKELDKLRGKHPIIELIERHRELSKLLTTYVDTLPKITDINGRVHTTFNQDIVSTGRLSSTSPNLQNIPVRTELGRKVRTAFIPQAGKVFVAADYSQFELRLAAILANDQPLIDDFNNDIDIHTKTAAEVYKIDMSQVTSDQRRNAKTINFGVLYGMSPHGLSAATNMQMTEAKQFIDHYFELRQPIRLYLDHILSQAEKLGFVETYFGRRRPTPDVNSKNYMVRESAKRAAMNMPIQGTEADLMKLAMIRVEEKLQNIAEPLLQIHDSILVECLPENVEKTSQILAREMENVCPELKIKLKVDVKVGKNWGEV